MITVIAFAAVAVVGLMELVKIYLPEGTSAKVKATISLVASVVVPVILGVTGLGGKLTVIQYVGAVAGTVTLVQVAYNFVLSLLKALTKKLKAEVAEVLNKK